MIGDTKGWVWTKKEFKFTRPRTADMVTTETEAESQNKAMRLTLLPVWDIAVDDSGYLCFIRMPEGEQGFIWDIDKRDTVRFAEGDFIGDMKRDIALTQQLEAMDADFSLDDLKAVNELMKKKTGLDFLRIIK